MMTSDMQDLLRQHYDANAWILLFEVANATGAQQHRWADAIAVGLWPSRGLHIHGHEIKVSRTDWLKELKTPAKAEAVYQYCDHWWLVVSDRDIVRGNELPPGWGLLVPNGRGGLKIAKPAPPLEPRPIDRGFLASLCRTAAKPAVREESAALRREYDRGYQDAAKSAESSHKRLRDQFAELQRQVLEFEAAAGFRLNAWGSTPARTGTIVRDVVDGRYNREAKDLERIRTLAQGIVASIDNSLVTETQAAG